MKDLEWKEFHGTTSQFKALTTKILTEDETQIQIQFIGMKGYALFADIHYKSNMLKTYHNISAVLDKELFQKLKWQAFNGTTSQFKKLAAKILAKDETHIQTQFIGMKGYALFAETHYKGNMKKTYLNISAVLDKELFQKLKWQQFEGTTSQFKALTTKILTEDETQIQIQFIGMKGYALFAETHYKGNMKKTYLNISAILDKELFQKLKWKTFHGNTKQFYKFIKDFRTNYPQNYYGLEGQKRVADDIFSGNTKKTYDMVSAMKDFFGLSKEFFHQLQWVRQ